MYVYRLWALIVDANASHIYFISKDNVYMYTETGI